MSHLEALAKAATPGERHVYPSTDPAGHVALYVGDCPYRPGSVIVGRVMPSDAAFIVAASPDVVLAMLDEIATLTARVEHYQRACITTSTEVTRVLGEALYGPTPDAWSTHTPEAIADEAASEIATLRAKVEALEALVPSDSELMHAYECVELSADDRDSTDVHTRMVVERWLNRVSAARKGGE